MAKKKRSGVEPDASYEEIIDHAKWAARMVNQHIIDNNERRRPWPKEMGDAWQCSDMVLALASGVILLRDAVGQGDAKQAGVVGFQMGYAYSRLLEVLPSEAVAAFGRIMASGRMQAAHGRKRKAKEDRPRLRAEAQEAIARARKQLIDAGTLHPSEKTVKAKAADLLGIKLAAIYKRLRE